MMDVSATRIRAAAQSNDAASLRTMVPAAVADYIEKYNLYQELNESEAKRKIFESGSAGGRRSRAAWRRGETCVNDFDERIRRALHAAAEKKALDPTVLDLRGIATLPISS